MNDVFDGLKMKSKIKIHDKAHAVAGRIELRVYMSNMTLKLWWYWWLEIDMDI